MSELATSRTSELVEQDLPRPPQQAVIVHRDDHRDDLRPGERDLDERDLHLEGVLALEHPLVVLENVTVVGNEPA